MGEVAQGNIEKKNNQDKNKISHFREIERQNFASPKIIYSSLIKSG